MLAGCAHVTPQGGAVTVVFVARAVRTLDPQRPVVQALAMREGRVLAVGTEAEVLAMAGPGASVERFPHGTIVPGLVDSHGHLAWLGESLAVVGLQGTAHPDDVVKRLTTAPSSAWRGGWLLGTGWDQNLWPQREWPTRAVLDAAFPATPVVLTRVDGHAVWVNGEALRRAGITRATPDPDGGRVLRDERGEPTGVLVDNALTLVTSRIPALAAQERALRLKLALEACARHGLTGVHDAGEDLATFQVLQQWDLVNALPLRVYAMAYGQGDDAENFLGRGVYRGNRLELRTVKFVLDGALGSRGAALETPYADEPGTSGSLLLSPQEFEQRARRVAAAGFQVAVHAIGDRANHLALSVLAALEHERPGSRHRIEHLQVVAREDLATLGQSGVVASVQPTHATSDWPWAEARLGAERSQLAYAWQQVRATGARLALGSDFPVESVNPLWGLYAARTRQTRSGEPAGGWHPDERLTGLQALEGFTVGAAWASFAEARRGQLKPGADADFVVLSADPVDEPAAQLLEATVELTVVDGVDVFRRQP